MFGKYSVNNLIAEFQKNRTVIHAYVSGNSLEGYQDNGYDDDDKKILGFSIGVFLIIFVIALAIWIWALVALLQNWNYLSDIAKILAVLAFIGILGGPVVTLIIVYAMRGNGNKRGSPNSGFRWKSR
jgi:hypothetical protein